MENTSEKDQKRYRLKSKEIVRKKKYGTKVA